jgi:hypothetical protein
LSRDTWFLARVGKLGSEGAAVERSVSGFVDPVQSGWDRERIEALDRSILTLSQPRVNARFAAVGAKRRRVQLGCPGPGNFAFLQHSKTSLHFTVIFLVKVAAVKLTL